MLRLAKEGVVGTDTLIWHPGLEEWNPIWKLMPQAIEHMKKNSPAQQAHSDTERVPVGEQDKMDKLSESMFRKLFARLRKS